MLGWFQTQDKPLCAYRQMHLSRCFNKRGVLIGANNVIGSEYVKYLGL